MAILELTAGALLAADFFYHRWFADDDEAKAQAKASFADSLDIPQTEEGSPIPYIYGKVRVTRPILAWHSTPSTIAGEEGSLAEGRTYFCASMFFLLGMPFADGDSTNRIHRVWQGDVEYQPALLGSTPPLVATPVTLEELDGDGDKEDENRGVAFIAARKIADDELTFSSGGAVEFLNGNPNQTLTDSTAPYFGNTRAGVQMRGVSSGDDIPGYRGVMSAFFYEVVRDGVDKTKFRWNIAPQLGPVSVEASSYKTDGGYPAVGVMGRSGEDSNPINALWDILTAKRKLGLPTSLLDVDSFGDAATTVYQESNGFSRCFDARMPAREMIREILRQVDGGIFEDPKTGKLKIKLVRPDYNYNDLPHITRQNCKAIENLSISTTEDVPNKILVRFRSRELGYLDDTAPAQNNANAVGQDGIERPETLDYLGVSNMANASRIAARELAALCRSVIKCRALVWRGFLDVGPLDAVRVTWSSPDLSGLVFRVAGPPYHGTLRDGVIALDLISDYQYQYRALPPQPPIDHPDIGSGISLGLGMR